MNKKFFGAAVLLAAIGNSFAGDISYSYIEAGVFDIDADGIDASGFGAGISGALNDVAFLTFGYTEAETDDEFTLFGVSDEITLSQLSLGLGLHTALSDNTDLVGEVSIGRAEVEFASAEAEETTKGLSIGLRSRLNQHFELSGGASYIDIDDESETSLGASIRFFPVPDFSLAVGFSSGDDTDVTSFSLRFDL